MSNWLDKESVQRKDLITSLVLWIVAEFVGFVMFPLLQLVRVDGGVMRNWFLTSLPLGLGGILLMVASSRLVVFNQEREHQMKTLAAVLAGIAGWVALAGILYPLWIVCWEFFTKGLPS
ncbi:hypothetical protein IQ266_10950 [filamentous cyanobacterium LEGE 11480]|uniref:Uncharacterized protein n=1 Tax=Romeriopsis navalis LEGE 11480 TaxID=2777977 RepID=A0A928VM55_9CYAN|nr:hypothetical protein [Romeriopsis navalis]MBE9030248.1 hypothetical protein [Romeriopsis navalis LEGE 11480]